MNPSAGLVTALNKMREMSVDSGDIFHQYFPVVDANTNIGEWGAPIFGANYQAVQESFFGLLKQIAYVATVTRLFDNPLSQLEGENIPLGWAGEETYINPVKGRQFDVNDFAGILQKYEADVKVQYLNVNMDIQYPVTLTRDKIRQAFTSWRDLEEFINGIVNALYNGAYINMFQYTKDLVSAAFSANKAAYIKVTPVTNEATGKAMIKKLRELYTLFQMPSSEYNAWKKVGGAGRPITTWCAPEDIVLIIRADIMAAVDVDVLAAAFNMDKADFIGRVITILTLMMVSRFTMVRASTVSSAIRLGSRLNSKIWRWICGSTLITAVGNTTSTWLRCTTIVYSLTVSSLPSMILL